MVRVFLLAAVLDALYLEHISLRVQISCTGDCAGMINTVLSGAISVHLSCILQCD